MVSDAPNGLQTLYLHVAGMRLVSGSVIFTHFYFRPSTHVSTRATTRNGSHVHAMKYVKAAVRKIVTSCNGKSIGAPWNLSIIGSNDLTCNVKLHGG